MKYTQKPVSIYPKNVLLQSHEMLHFVAISHEYQILNVFKTSSSWHRHVVVSDTLYSSAHHTPWHIFISSY